MLNNVALRRQIVRCVFDISKMVQKLSSIMVERKRMLQSQLSGYLKMMKSPRCMLLSLKHELLWIVWQGYRGQPFCRGCKMKSAGPFDFFMVPNTLYNLSAIDASTNVETSIFNLEKDNLIERKKNTCTDSTKSMYIRSYCQIPFSRKLESSVHPLKSGSYVDKDTHNHQVW